MTQSHPSWPRPGSAAPGADRLREGWTGSCCHERVVSEQGDTRGRSVRGRENVVVSVPAASQAKQGTEPPEPHLGLGCVLSQPVFLKQTIAGVEPIEMYTRPSGQ